MKRIIALLNGLVSAIVGIALLAGGAFAGYALWDNRQVYSAAQGVQLEMLRLKPTVVEDESGEVVAAPTFDDLLAVNPDVCAWVSLENTNIDHPVLRGETNFTYINTDVYGDFALAGSIFMDVRCARDFSDPYTLLYGHHMANHGMFGDLELFKSEGFFEANAWGELLLPGQVHRLLVLACVVAEASDEALFDPEVWQGDAARLIDYCGENALFVRRDAMESLRARLAAGETVPRVLALSTCSDEYTNARTILITLIDPGEIAAGDDLEA